MEPPEVADFGSRGGEQLDVFPSFFNG
jgi:hypothetical protein